MDRAHIPMVESLEATRPGRLLQQRLLRKFQFPEIDALAKELHNGFKVTGELVAGPGWLPRTDDRYRYPISEGFRKINRSHTLNRLNNYRVDEHWEPMYQELLQELQLGRMEVADRPLTSRATRPRPWSTPTSGELSASR